MALETSTEVELYRKTAKVTTEVTVRVGVMALSGAVRLMLDIISYTPADLTGNLISE